MNQIIKQHMSSHGEVLSKLSEDTYVNILNAIAKTILDCYSKGGKLLICGNGGSAGDAQHLAAEMVVRFEATRMALPAIALNANSSSLTAIGNDISADSIFERQVEAFGNKGDVLIAISTSGNSENIRLAMEKARRKGLTVVAFLGKTGGSCAKLADLALIVPSDRTAYIQEMHIMCAHILCGIVDLWALGEVDI